MKLSGIPPRRKFIAVLLATTLALRGHANYWNLASYGAYSERTYSRQFPWSEFHAKTLQSVTANTHELIAAQDASFIPKSGKKTYGLDKFFNCCASQPERSLENRLYFQLLVRKRAETCRVFFVRWFFFGRALREICKA